MQLPFQYSQRCVMSLAECVCVLMVCEGAYGWAVYHINQACHWIFGHHSPDHQPLTPTVTICWWLLLFLLTNIVIDHLLTLSDTLQSTLTHIDQEWSCTSLWFWILFQNLFNLAAFRSILGCSLMVYGMGWASPQHSPDSDILRQKKLCKNLRNSDREKV